MRELKMAATSICLNKRMYCALQHIQIHSIIRIIHLKFDGCTYDSVILVYDNICQDMSRYVQICQDMSRDVKKV